MFKKALLSVLIWAACSALTILLFLVMLVLTVLTFPFDRQRRIVHAQCFWWSDAVIRLNPYWKVTIHGLRNIDPGKTYVIVANHQSLGDIAIMYQTRMQFKWVAKESLFRVPFIGWNMRLARHICLARGNFSSIKKVYREAAGWLKDGMSVFFFPEGTRSAGSEMNEFQNGAFKLAIKEKVPVLPVSIKGTGNAIPKGSWLFSTKTHGILTILPPIDTARLGPADFGKLRDLTRSKLDAA